MSRIIIVLAAAALLLGVGAEGAQASPDRYTKGDALAMLNTYPATDQIFTRLDSALVEHGLDIRPFPFIYDEVPYCVEDWHVLALAVWDVDFEAPLIPITYTREEVWVGLQDAGAQFILDGAPIGVERTPIRIALDKAALSEFEVFFEELFGEASVGHIWGVQWGRIMAPDELAVGQHTLRVIVTFGDGSLAFDDTTTFQVSGPDSPPCTGVS